jgi:UDP-glucose 4-epimerase
MKILVTGGAGFIGSHIVDLLISEGHEVCVVDDLSTGSKGNLNTEAAFYRVDIRDRKLEDVVGTQRPEVVCHQAARANVRESMLKPLDYADVNVLGSLNLLEVCRKHGVRKVVYASTGGAVYGEPQKLPVTEDHPINPLDPYGASKHFVEHYLYLYRQHYGIQYVALRYPNVFGPRQDPYGEAGVVAIFSRELLDGTQPVINGSGEQERDFVFVSDVVEANLRAIEKDAEGIYNIGRGVGVSVNQVYETLVGLVGGGRDRVHGSAKEGEVYKIYLDAARAKEELGWEPCVSLQDGLSETVEYLKAKTPCERK